MELLFNFIIMRRLINIHVQNIGHFYELGGDKTKWDILFGAKIITCANSALLFVDWTLLN